MPGLSPPTLFGGWEVCQGRPCALLDAAGSCKKCVGDRGMPIHYLCSVGSLLPGIHQFHRPNKRIVAGTSNVLTIVASTSTANAIPSPISFVTTIEVKVKAPATITNSSAAFVITPPVFSSPYATAQRLLYVLNHSSRIRLSKKTS